MRLLWVVPFAVKPTSPNSLRQRQQLLNSTEIGGQEFQQGSTGCGGMFLFSNVWTSSRKAAMSASDSAGRKSTSGTRVPELASLQLVSGKSTCPPLVLSYQDSKALYVMSKAPTNDLQKLPGITTLYIGRMESHSWRWDTGSEETHLHWIICDYIL